MFKNYVEVRDWLESFIPLVYGKEELGLARIENLLGKLGNPQKNFKSILVGGTAGKGSTAYYIARLLQFLENSEKSEKQKTLRNQKARESEISENLEIRKSEFSGMKIGLHLSPHLVYIGERMQVNGVPIPVKRLVALVNEIKPVIDDIKSKQPELLPSYFEILVALSFLYFKEEKVEWAVVEVGLGGRLDATNILESEISVITNVGLDHTELLGNTIEKIAREKAGIIKNVSNVSNVSTPIKSGSRVSKGVPVVTGATGKALKVIEKVAKSNNSKLINIYTQGLRNVRKLDLFRSVFKAKDLYSYIPYYVNSECALLALSAVLELKMPLSGETIKKAFSRQFAGRFEEIDDGVIVDGAHNTDKIRSLIEFVRNPKFEIRNSKITLVVAFKKGKNWQEMIGLLMQNLPIKKIIATEYKSVTDTGLGSAVELEEIAKYVESRKYKHSFSSKKVLSIKTINNSQEAVFEAIQSVQESKSERVRDLVLVTGSLYLVGEVRTLWKLPEF